MKNNKTNILEVNELVATTLEFNKMSFIDMLLNMFSREKKKILVEVYVKNANINLSKDFYQKGLSEVKICSLNKRYFYVEITHYFKFINVTSYFGINKTIKPIIKNIAETYKIDVITYKVVISTVEIDRIKHNEVEDMNIKI
jgi:hypothetical protein